MRTLLSLILPLLFTMIASGQDLPRRGSLGVMIGPTEDSLSILVQQVIAGGTGSALGLIDGDVILSVNGERFDNTFALVRHTSEWRMGQPVEVLIQRNGKQQLLTGNVAGKPKETSNFGQVIYRSVNYDGGQLRSILVLPHHVEKPPVLFYLPGIGCSSMDYYFNQQLPIKQFVEGMVERGVAVYRVEKPGMGDSRGTQSCEEMDYRYEVEAFATALEGLKSMGEIDTEKIFLYGHSLGGLTAPLLAERSQVKGVVLYGSVSTSWYEYSLRLLRDQPVHRQTDYLTIEETFRKHQPFIYDFLVNKKTREQLAAIPEYQEPLNHYFPLDNDLFYGLQHYRFVQQLNDINLPKAWKNSNCQVLAVYGELDIHAIDSRWARHTADMVNYYHPGKGAWKLLPKTEHMYAVVPNMKEHIRMRDDGTLNGSYLAQNFNREILTIVGEWIDQVLDS